MLQFAPPRIQHQPRHLGNLAPLKRPAAVDPRIVLATLALLLVVAAAYTLSSLVVPLILGAWIAHLTRPLFARVSGALRGRQKAAALLTAALVLVISAPIVLAVTTLVPAAKSLIAQLTRAQGVRDALGALVANGGSEQMSSGGIVSMIKDYGATASKVVALIASASLDALVGTFVFFVAFFAMLVEGERGYAWLERHSPLEPSVLRRFTGAFYQAGRGLLIGTGLTALAQGTAATIIFASLGIPRALLLGLLSTVAALIPTTGATLVWIPVAAALALTGEPGKAALLAGLCAVIVGSIDNIMRPWLSRRANVGLSGTVVLLSVFGGLAAFGPWGLLLGPLVIRLAMEALALARERHVFN